MKDYRLIHSCFCKCSGNYDLILSMGRIYYWEQWEAQGWTEADLEAVIHHVKAQIRDGKLWASALRFSRLVCDHEFFSEMLTEARALARKPHYAPDKAAVLRATQRPDEPEQRPARTAADVMRGDEELRKFIEFGKSL